MMRFGLRISGITCLVVSFLMCWQLKAWGYYLDEGNTMKFGLRAYVNARIGTEDTDRTKVVDPMGPGPTDDVSVLESQTFPYSPAGHLRQNRFFVEAELDHDVTDLMRNGFGPLAALNYLPFKIRKLKYHLTYRGEAEGIYDWGPREFRTRDSASYLDLLRDASGRINPPSSCTLETCPDIERTRSELHRNATNRHRLYQAYIDMTVGDLFLRVGRQILVWGETDPFRLLDNINPVDSSFGGILIPLDQRRVPIDMVRANYYLGELGPHVSEASLEGFVAIDDAVSYYPGLQDGTPWELPNNGTPSGQQEDTILTPQRTFSDARGGARFSFNTAFSDELEVTWSLNHYYSYADIPNVQVCVNPGLNFNGFPFHRVGKDEKNIQALGGRIPGCNLTPSPLPLTQRPACGPGQDPRFDNCRARGEYDVLAPQAFTIQQPAKIQISGLTSTFAVPSTLSRQLGLSGEPIIRMELAYIKDEPYHRQRTLDPFIFHPQSFDPNAVKATGGILKRDSINFVLGIDTNQFIRFLNARNSFFISTQFFYKHIKGHDDDAVLPVRARNVQNSEIALKGLGAVEPILVTTDQDQFLQTLLISTSYRSGTINPSFVFFYDWSGARVYIPSVTFIHDPFRFTLQMNILDAANLKGNSGVSLLRDRDNVLFQVEYVI